MAKILMVEGVVVAALEVVVLLAVLDWAAEELMCQAVVKIEVELIASVMVPEVGRRKVVVGYSLEGKRTEDSNLGQVLILQVVAEAGYCGPRQGWDAVAVKVDSA